MKSEYTYRLYFLYDLFLLDRDGMDPKYVILDDRTKKQHELVLLDDRAEKQYELIRQPRRLPRGDRRFAIKRLRVHVCDNPHCHQKVCRNKTQPHFPGTYRQWREMAKLTVEEKKAMYLRGELDCTWNCANCWSKELQWPMGTQEERWSLYLQLGILNKRELEKNKIYKLDHKEK